MFRGSRVVANDSVRQLILVRVMHTQADMGSVSESVRALYNRKFGKRQWECHVKAVDNTWRTIRNKINRMDLDYEKLRLYQDGLPHCGREADIVTALAEAGSQNHRLLLDLMEKGAQLVGTESPELLMEEYELVQRALKSLESGGSDDLAGPLGGEREALLKRRDRYIANRIDETLHEDETGMIFLGLLHSLGEHLPQDVRLSTLDEAVRLLGE